MKKFEITDEEKQVIDDIINFFVSKIKANKKIAAIEMETLYSTMGDSQKQFIEERLLSVNPEDYGVRRQKLPESPAPSDLVVIENQTYTAGGQTFPIPPRLLPSEIYEICQKMKQEMKSDIKEDVVILSGYRSSAYQVFVFLFQLRKNNYDFAETLRMVELPYHSEHAYPPRQAVDFKAKKFPVSDSEYDFSKTPQYKWMVVHAKEFGFTLSYPENNKNGVVFEPWHWSYRP